MEAFGPETIEQYMREQVRDKLEKIIEEEVMLAIVAGRYQRIGEETKFVQAAACMFSQTKLGLKSSGADSLTAEADCVGVYDYRDSSLVPGASYAAFNKMDRRRSAAYATYPPTIYLAPTQRPSVSSMTSEVIVRSLHCQRRFCRRGEHLASIPCAPCVMNDP